MIGKAVLFAPAASVFPADGPWQATLASLPRTDPWHLPAFADIPLAGQRIEGGRPVLTFYTRAGSPATCLDALRQMAVNLDRRLRKA
jgi:hypothetical protein